MALDNFQQFMTMAPEELDRAAAEMAITGAPPPPFEQLPQVLDMLQKAQASGVLQGMGGGGQGPQGGGGGGFVPQVPPGMPPAAPQQGRPQLLPPASPQDLQEGVHPIPPANPLPATQNPRMMQNNQYLQMLLGRG